MKAKSKKLIKDLRSPKLTIAIGNGTDSLLKPSRLDSLAVKHAKRIDMIVKACRLLTIDEVSDVLYLAEKKMKGTTKV